MKVLAFDTSTLRGSVALLEDSEVRAELRILSLETHSARLLGSIDFLLERAGWRLGDLGLIAAGIGPGSFTGIRIGVATALGLAETLSVPFAGISCLDALASSLPGIEGRIAVVMDAQRSQVYFAEYEKKGGRTRKTARPMLLYPDELKSRLRKVHLYLIGDGALRYATALRTGGRRWPQILDVDLFLGAALGRLALQRKRAWKSGDSLKSEPLYVRPPDARRPKARQK